VGLQRDELGQKRAVWGLQLVLGAEIHSEESGVVWKMRCWWSKKTQPCVVGSHTRLFTGGRTPEVKDAPVLEWLPSSQSGCMGGFVTFRPSLEMGMNNVRWWQCFCPALKKTVAGFPPSHLAFSVAQGSSAITRPLVGSFPPAVIRGDNLQKSPT